MLQLGIDRNDYIYRLPFVRHPADGREFFLLAYLAFFLPNNSLFLHRLPVNAGHNPKNMSDITVTIIDREGTEHALLAPTDMQMNIMELCKSYELPVKGECGGMAMCATCQCYLESDHELAEPTDDELDMLDQAFFVKPNSRLGCQIPITDEIDGIVLRLAPEVD